MKGLTYRDPDAQTDQPTRRRVLATLGGLSIAGLAGCAGAGDSDDDVSLQFSHPDRVRLTESFSLEIGDIPHETVDVVVSLTDHEDNEWTTEATYETADGQLAFDSATPVDGEFDAGTMRLIQWATPETATNSYGPNSRDSDDVTVRVEHDGETVDTTTIDRTVIDSDVTETRVDSDDFVGWVAEPPGDDPAPAILLLHGSGGSPARGRSQILASRGFVTLALQYFDPRGEEDLLPTELSEVPVDFVESAIDWLLGHDRVSGSQVGVWGGSKGGELALLSASRFDAIGPVVSVNGSGVVWEGIGTNSQLGSSWSIDGDPVPHVPYADDPSIWNSKEYEPVYTTSYEEATDEEIAAATIPVEEIDGPVLLVSGGDDRLWPSVRLHTISADRLADHDREYEDEDDHLVYDDAGHAITYPFLPTANRTENAQYVFGGTQEGYAEADRDYWPKMVETFETLRS